MLRWIEGFESHRHINQLNRKYASFSGSLAAQAGRVFGNSISPGSGGFIAVTPAWALDNTVVLGFGLIFTAHSAALNTGSQGIYLERGAAEQFHIRFESTSGSGYRIHVKRGSTVLYTSGYFDFNIWSYIEIKGVARTGTNGSFELRVNGVSIESQASINLAASGSDGVDKMAIRISGNTTVARIDDMYVNDGTGSVNNDLLGPSVVEGIAVTGNGDTIQWTNDAGSGSNYENVDDGAAANPNDTGAGGTNSSDTNGQKDLYAMSDIVEISGQIHGIQIGMQLAMQSAGTRTVKGKFKDSVAGEADGPNFVVDSTVFDEFTAIYENNPATTDPWLIDEIDAGQFGVEVVS